MYESRSYCGKLEDSGMRGRREKREGAEKAIEENVQAAGSFGMISTVFNSRSTS